MSMKKRNLHLDYKTCRNCEHNSYADYKHDEAHGVIECKNEKSKFFDDMLTPPSDHFHDAHELCGLYKRYRVRPPPQYIKVRNIRCL